MDILGQALTYLVGLTAMEIVLGIDNIVFLTIVAGQLPAHQQPNARRIGLALALIMRLVLLAGLSWILSLQEPVFQLTDIGIPASWFEIAHPDGLSEVDLEIERRQLEEMKAVSWKDLILLAGGLFLIAKSVHEIHKKVAGDPDEHAKASKANFGAVLAQIVLLDLVFSLDSVIVAVGMVPEQFHWVMYVAVIIAIAVMLIFAGPVSDFVSRNPTLKMLALAFLILIGVMLFAEGIGAHLDKGYIYFAMSFALVVEFLNLRVKRRLAARHHAVKKE